MCGIAGIIFKQDALINANFIASATNKIHRRGPDHQATFIDHQVHFGHRRLSILDTSEAAHQPMTDTSGNYTIIFNGEIFNFKTIKAVLMSKGYEFYTTGDTEVLLYAFIEWKEKCLEQLNGFFCFAIFDKKENSVFIARDRMGIKPLSFYCDENYFAFSSELKAIYALPIKKEINFSALKLYFQLNYIPAPASIYKNVQKLLPGHYIQYNLSTHQFSIAKYFELPAPKEAVNSNLTYDSAQEILKAKLSESVQLRMISDVPLGAFLSGGIDSSIIVSQATKFTTQLNTFSIGFADNPYFDETQYAELVAKRFNTNHTVFKLTNHELLESMHVLFDYIDEPFADSSALLVNILSQKTREKVTVALSGDGGDELFAGYNKHLAEYRIRNKGFKELAVKSLHPLWKAFPQARHSTFANFIRQLDRFATGAKMNNQERYWRWCSFIDEQDVNQYFINTPETKEYSDIKKHYLKGISNDNGTLNENLWADIQLVLPNDMLTKVDLMSMANSLEVRVPLLDHNVVEFANSLPVNFKIDGKMKKKILQDAFRNELPAALYNRPKKGFEVPLLQWMRNELKSLILDDLLADKWIEEQQIFNLKYIQSLKARLFSNNPGDVHAQIWALLIFQKWYKNYHLAD
jgi:asparagine synthase (glutamine-hydrolysing)